MTTTSSSKPPIKSKQKSTASKHSIISLIAFILGIIAIVIAALAWQQTSSVQSTLDNRATQLQQSIAALKAELKQVQSNLQNAITANQKNISQLMSQGGDTAQQQAIGEAGYLIRLAHLHLTMDKNIHLGIKLLKLAAEQLDTVTTPAATRLKVAIAHDVATLSAVPQINTINLLTQLDRLSDEIAKLPTQSQMSPQSTTSPSPTTPPQHWWGKVKHNLGALKQLFIIRHFDKPIAPLLMPQQVIFLKDNIRLKISQAQWAVLHRSTKLYRQSLNLAVQWLNQYDQNQPATEQIIKKLQALAIINITPDIPTSLKSLQVLNSLSSPDQDHSSNGTDDQTEDADQ